MPNERKIQIVSELQQKLQDAQGIIFASYAGLTVPDLQDLRAKLRDTSSELKVVKNTLLQLALKKVGGQRSKVQLEGPTAVVLSYEDEIAPLKVLSEFANEHDALAVKGGFFEGQWTTAEVLAEIAQLPGVETLRAKLAGTLQAPLTRLNGVLQGKQRDLVVLLNEIAKRNSGA